MKLILISMILAAMLASMPSKASNAITIGEFLQIKDQVENKYACDLPDNIEVVDFIYSVLGLERRELVSNTFRLYPISSKNKKEIIEKGLKKDTFSYVNQKVICMKDSEAYVLTYNTSREHYEENGIGWVAVLKFSYIKEGGNFKLIPVINKSSYFYHKKLSDGWYGKVKLKYLTNPKL